VNDTCKPDELLTRPAAAKYLAISMSTLNRLANLGVVRRVFITRDCIRFKRSDLDRYIQAAQEVPA
jgi:excisionase family DNA binding protein